LGQWRFRFESCFVSSDCCSFNIEQFCETSSLCLIELIFGQYDGNLYVYLSTKFRDIWIGGLRVVH
jgi:hypothetical protein